MLTTMPKVCVYFCELQLEHYKNTSQGKITLVLPEFAFVMCIAVTEGRGRPILALFHEKGKTGISFFFLLPS